MKRRFLPLGALFLLVAIPACTAYQDLKRDWERYEPTPFYRHYAQTKPVSEVPSAPRDVDFEKQVAKIKETKEKWQKAVETDEEKGAFYQPEPGLLKELSPAGIDLSVAGAALARGFSLQEMETLVLVRNPGVKSAERTLRASIEAYSQVSNLDEILRQYSAFTKDLMTGVGAMEGGETMEMKFPFPGVLALKGEVVTAEVKASREALEIARRTAITKSRQTYWNLLYVIRAQEITREMLSLLQHLESVATSRYETGKTNFQDLIKIRIERDKMGEEFKTLGEEQRNLEAKIMEILDLPPGTPMGRPRVQKPRVAVPLLAALYPVAREKKQELRQMRAMIGKMERMIEMAETMIYPPYSLGLSLFSNETIAQTGTMRMKDPFPARTTASMGAGLPKMPWYGTNDAYLRETRQKLAALRADLKKMENETIFMVREAWFRLDQARREEALYADRIVNLSQAALEVSRRGYETGMVSFADVIMSYTGWLNDNLAMERRRGDLGISHAELQEAVGTSFPKEKRSND